MELMTDDPLKLAVAGGATALWALMSAFSLWRGRAQGPEAGDEACDVLVISASQTGQAEELARHSAAALRAGGQKVRCLTADAVGPEDMQAAGRLLVVASTTGVGDAPDDGRALERRVMSARPDLSRQRFAVLALGDRSYADFCAFGHRVEDWLKACGATALKPCLEVDDLEAAALKQWDNYLREWGGETVAGADAFQPCTLTGRLCLNPESSAAGLYQLDLALPEGAHWQAGDLAEIRTPDGHRRDYSIASLPEDGALRLYVREVIRADGTRGVGSALLTQGLGIGEAVPLRLKTHRNFHAPEGPETAPVLLIGAGSGLAGLRPHLMRLAAQARPVWLIYGERHPQKDGALIADLRQAQADGRLTRLDLAFSRADTGEQRYVQHVLGQKADEVRAFLSDEAAVMVCGGLDMGRAVEAALSEIVGPQWLEAALNAGRYRRDLY